MNSLILIAGAILHFEQFIDNANLMLNTDRVRKQQPKKFKHSSYNRALNSFAVERLVVFIFYNTCPFDAVVFEQFKSIKSDLVRVQVL